ncbi:unnamed protein product [Rotaria socialis]
MIIFYNARILGFLLTLGENKTIIAASNPSVTVTSGQKAILSCIFNRIDEDLSSYQLIWIRHSRAAYEADLILAHNQDLLIVDDRLNVQRTQNDYKLTLTDVTGDDEGTYACEVNTPTPQKSFIHLYVQETPTFIDNATSSPVVVHEYSNVTMECQARGRPKPYITWFRRINSGDNQTKSESQLLTNNTNGQLHLFNISRSQIGHYECRASNGVNGHVVSKDIELRVLCKIMTSWFVILNLTLLLSSSFLQARFRTYSKRRYVPSNKPFYQPISSDDNSDPMVNDDSLIESATGKVTKNLKNQASEQQIEQFARLLFDRLNLKEPPNVTVEINLEADSPPPFVKQLEQEYLKTKEQQDQSRDESQAVTERAVLPGARISSYTCQRQISAQLNIKHDNLKNIDCFKFSKSPLESASLPTNQIAQQLRVYIKKNFFVLNEQQEDLLAPDMFQIYQVFRPTSNDTSIKPSPSLKDTMRLPISQIKELNDNWLELTIDPNNEKLTIEQIYQQFITPWYGLAINHQLKSSWPPSYRSYPSENRFERSNDDEDNSEESKEQQLLYMLVEYSSKLRSPSTGHRSIRSNSKPRPAKPCDPKSPCCRRSLIIDLDQGNNVLDFVIHPRQFDIGECVGSCDTSGSSLQYTQAKNDQQKNKPHAAYSLVFLHRHGRNNNSLTATRNHRADRESSRCCSFSRTGGLELTYTTTNDGPIIKKYIPNMIVESCRCGLPATIQQV